MARITVEDCIDKVENQYDLVLLAKERTSQLNSGSEISVERDNDKNTVVSLREIASGKLKAEELKQSAILRLRKEPDEVVVEEETEEVSSDDFDQLYKGEVSKTGVAILPSKRMRRAPSQTNTSKEEKLDDSPKEDSPPLELTEEVKEEEKK
tara:strand:+ start:3637 stop:4092 length:456 start_codon:yes stop_codon:yes gene_type:complete